MNPPRKKHEDFSEKRRLNKLKIEVGEARLRWEKIVQENMIKKYTAKGNSDRSPSRVVYFSHSGAWCDEMKKEMQKLQAKISGLMNKDVQKLQAKIAGLKYYSTKQPRALWMPTVIENPSRVEVRIYQAISTRNVDVHQAKSFAKKAGFNCKISNKENYVIKATTGRSYKIKFTNEQGTFSNGLTGWFVCLCNECSSIPSVKEIDMSRRSNSDFKDAVCIYRNSRLYSKKIISTIELPQKEDDDLDDDGFLDDFGEDDLDFDDDDDFKL